MSRTVEQWAERFVAEEVRATTPNEKKMPWRVVRSCLVRYFRYHEVDKGKPGRINRALREQLRIAGYESDDNDYYNLALNVGSWPEFAGEIDKLMRAEGRA